MISSPGDRVIMTLFNKEEAGTVVNRHIYKEGSRFVFRIEVLFNNGRLYRSSPELLRLEKDDEPLLIPGPPVEAPKFNIGDKVIISTDHLVGEITKVVSYNWTKDYYYNTETYLMDHFHCPGQKIKVSTLLCEAELVLTRGGG